MHAFRISFQRIQPRQPQEPHFGDPLKYRHHTSYPQHGQHRSQPHAQKHMARGSANDQRAGHTAQVKAVLAQPQLLPRPHGNAVHDAVPGVRHQHHIHRHGCTNPRQQDSQRQQDMQ